MIHKFQCFHYFHSFIYSVFNFSFGQSFVHCYVNQLQRLCSFIYSSMALQPSVEPWPLLQFRNFFTQTVGFLGRVISPFQGRYLHTGQHKHRIKAHTDIHVWSGIRTHDPRVRASEDSSCLRLLSHCDRRKVYVLSGNQSM
jgi:hypothetical protein